MLSLRNKRESFTSLNTPIVLFILIIITISRIYSLYVSPIELSVDEAQYWHWSRNIDFGYYTKPPLIAWMIGFSTFIFGNEEWAVRLFSPITHLFISLVLWGTAKFAFGPISGKVVALIWIFTPAASLGGFIISTDTPLLFFWSLSLFFLMISLRQDSSLSSLFVGIFLGFAFLSKYAALYFLIFFVIWWLIYDRNKFLSFKNILIILFTSTLIASTNLYWNYLNDFATVNHTISNANLSEITLNYNNVIDFLSSQFLVFGPLLFLLYLLVIIDSFFKNRDITLLAMISFPIIFLITVQSFLKIANANWAVTAYVGATLVIGYYVTMTRSTVFKIFFYLGLLLNITISTYILIITINGSFYPLNLKSNPLRKNLGFENLASKIHDTFTEEKISKIIFDKRGDISRFNYYLNRHNNNFEKKIFIKTNSLVPGNFYEANFNYDLINKTKGEKILIVKNISNLTENNYGLSEIKLIKSISTKTVKNLERTYYLYVGKIR
jgi:4-amino-4-deoxy-L-arabinose transferase-like glycosyltransferase